jgi:hypothetical protein
MKAARNPAPPAPPDIVEEIYNQLWFKMGAQLCNFDFYARHIPRLQADYGHEAVSAALRQHHAQMRRSTSDQIRSQRNHAPRLKRESPRKPPK